MLPQIECKIDQTGQIFRLIKIQCSPFITLCLSSIGIGMDCFICESCYKGTILQRNYRTMTILWSFSYNSFVKFHGTKLGSHSMTVLYQICVIMRCVIKGFHCNWLICIKMNSISKTPILDIKGCSFD